MKLFLNNYFIKNTTTKMTYSEIYYLWKKYMNQKNIPDLYTETKFFQKIKETIKELEIEGDDKEIKYIYNEHLKTVREFREFWETHIKIEKHDEIEISECFICLSKRQI